MPEIESEYSSGYKRIAVAGIFGGTRPFGVEAVLYSERMDVKKTLETQPLEPNRITIKRIIECELHIDPMQMKSMHKWLDAKIKEYEKMFGPIPSPEEVAGRTRRSSDPGQ